MARGRRTQSPRQGLSLPDVRRAGAPPKHEHRLASVRGGAGLFCFVPTYDLLIRPGVPVLQLGMAPMWIIALGAGALGAALVAAAILGPKRTVIFDPVARELRDLGAADIGLRWSRRYPFRDLGAPAVERVCETDGPDTWRIVIPCAGHKRPLNIESYKEEAAAQEAANRIASLIAPGAP